MKSYAPTVEFCIKIVENGEIYYEDGVINDIPENFSKEGAIIQLKRACRANRWYLADIVYLVFSYWCEGEQYTRYWIGDIQDFC